MATHECIVNEWAEQTEANERACEDLRAAARRIGRGKGEKRP